MFFAIGAIKFGEMVNAMNIFTFLTFFSFVIYVYLSIYVFHLDRTSRLNRVFVAITAGLAWKSFAYLFFHSAPSPEECFYWYKISALGWNMLPGVAIHYALILADREDWLKRNSTYLIIYLPGIFYVLCLWTGDYVQTADFVRRLNWSVVTTNSNQWLLGFSKLYFAAASAICLYSTWLLRKSSETTGRRKKQADILAKTLLFSAATGITTDIVLPLLNFNQLPQMAHFFIVFWILGIWYAITRYRFMTITPALASDEIISKIFDILILAAPDGTISRVNMHALISGGYIEDELTGRHISVLVHSKELDRAFFAADGIVNYVANAEFITKSMGSIAINVSCARVRDEFGDIAGMVICGHDLRPLNRILHEVAERKAAEEKLRNANDGLEIRVKERTAELALSNEQLRSEMEKRKIAEIEILKMSKMESLGVLAGGIAHDFNNLLTGILNNISLAKLYCKDKREAADRLSGAEEVTLKAQNLAAQFLTFSKGGVLNKKIIDVRALLKESVEFTLSGSGVSCAFNFAGGLWNVSADASQLNQVFTNLVINAMHVMPDGGRIDVAAENVSEGNCHENRNIAAADYVKISIKDQGPGIPPDILPKIFDPYFTTKSNGSGLGLTSAFSVVRNHGGHIGVDSRPNEGATFFMYLPAAAGKQAEAVENSTDAIAGVACRALVMDDEEAIRSSVKEILRFWGCEVETAKDGSEAVEHYLRARKAGRPFEILLFDFTVPGGMNGIQALEEIRKTDRDVRAILSSGYMNHESSSDYLACGFGYFLQKPYKVAELNNAIKKLLNRK
ncbi:MAG: hypothetical protein ACD_47C00348G0001 [uncultured bacterium]|nr:MAG: hypothetical protein ACD_47C00348G0001 [uncultured bacterium]HBC74027.1 hypothetical protein [Candidatus Wallbacteria bacterium]